MCVDISHFCSKMEKYAGNIDFLNELLNTLFLLIIPTNYFNEDKPWDNTCEDKITKVWHNINEKYKIEEGSDIYVISDTVRHMFSSYKKFGIIGLYKYRETEDWYPRVKINKIIEPNDIDSLENSITVYRGTRQNEYDSGQFSQSWTLDKNIAQRFPIKNTAGKTYSDNNIILETIINKEDIFYYDSGEGIEKEVIVNTDKIIKHKVNIVE